MKKTILFSIILVILASCQNKEKYDATGIFEANTVTVSSETNGKLVSFAIEEGDSIINGQQVGLVDTIMLALQQKQLLSSSWLPRNRRPTLQHKQRH